MHPCLRISEILRNILFSISPYQDDETTLRDVADTALVCRTFYGLASDVLWHTLYDLSPLFMCLPSPLWDDSQEEAYDDGIVITLDLDHHLGNADWDIVTKHAHRVKVLRWDFKRWNAGFKARYRVSPGVLHQLAHHIQVTRNTDLSYSFLPNLTELSWEFLFHTDAMTHYIPLIGGPSLKVLSIFGEHEPPSHPQAVEAMRRALETIPERYPHLQKLAFLGVPERHWHINAALSHLIGSLPKLRYIENSFGGLDAAAYVHITHLPDLAVYHGGLPSSLDHPALRPPPILPAIRDLRLEVAGLDFANTLLRGISSTQLQNLAISGEISLSFTSTSARELFETLKPQVGLEEFTITSDPNESADFPGDASTYVIDPRSFSPLLHLGNMKEVYLQYAWAIDFDDRLIRDLALAWPRLSILVLQPFLPLPDPPRSTLGGLMELARHCRALQILGLPLNPIPSTQENDTMVIDPRDYQLNLGVLHIFYWSRLPDPSATAKHLLEIFPSIASHVDVFGVGSVADDVRQEWRSFRSFIEGYGAALALQAQSDSGSDSDSDSDVDMG